MCFREVHINIEPLFRYAGRMALGRSPARTAMSIQKSNSPVERDLFPTACATRSRLKASETAYGPARVLVDLRSCCGVESRMLSIGDQQSTTAAFRGDVLFDAKKPLPYGHVSPGGVTRDEWNGMVRNHAIPPLPIMLRCRFAMCRGATPQQGPSGAAVALLRAGV